MVSLSIREFFDRAVDSDPAARERLLAIADDNPSIRAELNSLIAAYDSVSDEFLADPVASMTAAALADLALMGQEGMPRQGDEIGKYKIERELGRGGMGAVYLAFRNDDLFNKQVAIKVLTGGVSTPSVIARFENERQILADLEHPFIARLIDGGLSRDGIPYVVLEYVDGEPVDLYCSGRGLSMNDRLELFLKICEAVQYAHDNSVIHRDIKPSNILVNMAGMPKLLDFGIAKITEPHRQTAVTVTGFLPMTPEYASPEQILGHQVGPSSDVYSLGVLLYKLLTERLPYEVKGCSPYEIARAVCDEEPMTFAVRSPSRWKRIEDRFRPVESVLVNRSDLQAILSRTLSKDPSDRYPTVRTLAEDIEMFLQGEPIRSQAARSIHRGLPAFGGYRFALAGIVLLLLILVGSWQFISADRVNQVSDGVLLASPSERVGAADPNAWSLYLRAQNLWEQRSAERTAEALELFQAAIVKDPQFALAYSGLANSYILLGVWNRVPTSDAFEKARKAAEEATILSPDSPEGYLSMAMVHWLYDWNWRAADEQFIRAVNLNPNYTLAWHWYGLYLAEIGRFDEAINAEGRALALEPLSVSINADLARVLFYARRYDQADRQYSRTLQINPNYDGCLGERLELYESAGMKQEWLRIAVNWDGLDAESRRVFQRDGIRGYLRRNAQITGEASRYYLSGAFKPAKGESLDQAFLILEEAYNARCHWMVQLKVSPRFDGLRDDPRFQQLLVRMGFVD